EPTTALDVTVQAQILRLLLELRDRSGLAIILVSHDLGVIASTCDRIAVMYAGRVMEQAPKAELLRQPRHPYTAGLIASRPSGGASCAGGRASCRRSMRCPPAAASTPVARMRRPPAARASCGCCRSARIMRARASAGVKSRWPHECAARGLRPAGRLSIVHAPQ